MRYKLFSVFMGMVLATLLSVCVCGAETPKSQARLPMGWWKSISVPDVPITKVHPTHPRIYVKDKPSADGSLTLAELRRRGTEAPWKNWIPRFTDDISSNAMKYLLIGDTAAADKAVAKLLQKYKPDADTTDGDDLEERCMAYDWLYAYPGFNAEKKKTAANEIATVADDLVKRLKTGGPHIFHTRMHAWANGIVFAGIALAGDHPKAAEYLNFGNRYWREKLFPSRWFLDGAWANGFGYGRKYLCRSTFAFLNVWKTATGENLWALIEKEQNDWARAMGMYLLYTHRPDGRYPAYGDSYNNDDEKFSCGLAMMASCGSRDPYLSGLVEVLHKKHALRCVEDHWNIYPLLFWDPSLPKKGPEDLPLGRVFGANALGAVVMRSGWGPTDSFVFYKCGNYIEDHGHFDQGGFEICRDQPLAVDSGSYAGGFNSNHRLQYYMQSVASNTLIICDPSNAKDTGNQRSHHWQGADCMDTYVARAECETGSILDFRNGPDYTSVVSDFTAAYEPSKVRSVTRSLVFLKGKYLIICDAVQPANVAQRVKFLLHYPTDATVVKNRITIDSGNSRLICDTLWPENAKLTKVAGFIVHGGGNHPPQASKEVKPDVGSGRVEVESNDANPVLLHVLTLGLKSITAETLKAKLQGRELSVDIAGKKISFDTSARTVTVK
jgi:hypothetical protein